MKHTKKAVESAIKFCKTEIVDGDERYLFTLEMLKVIQEAIEKDEQE